MARGLRRLERKAADAVGATQNDPTADDRLKFVSYNGEPPATEQEVLMAYQAQWGQDWREQQADQDAKAAGGMVTFQEAVEGTVAAMKDADTSRAGVEEALGGQLPNDWSIYQPGTDPWADVDEAADEDAPEEAGTYDPFTHWVSHDGDPREIIWDSSEDEADDDVEGLAWKATDIDVDAQAGEASEGPEAWAEAWAESEAEAWDGRPPPASYEEWLAEGADDADTDEASL